jgi:CHASE2 domain-containing sensor protein
MATLTAVLATLILTDLIPRFAPGLLRIEHALADLRTALLSDRLPSQHPQVAIVGITDQTLSPFKTRLPIDRHLLARVVDAIDAAGAKAIGLDILFSSTIPADNEDMLLEAIRRSRAKVVLAAADERVGLSQSQGERQSAFFAEAQRPAGYANLAVERDWVVRFKAQAAPGSRFEKSFAHLLAAAAGMTDISQHRRIAWLRPPLDGSDTFLTIPAESLLGPASDTLVQAARDALKGKIVIVGALLADVDQHLTPLTALAGEMMPGAVIHAHLVAEMVDGRSVGQLETNSLAMRGGLALLTGLGFLIGWRYRLRRKGLLLSSLATIAVLVVDTIVFWQLRFILPSLLALLAWFIGEFSGHWLGKWLK